MSVWSAILKVMNANSVHQQVKATGVLMDEEGWYYEETQNFSRSQSTVRVDQQRPGNWETLESSCGIVGLNKPVRHKEVARFFAGSYRWLRLERELIGLKANNVIKVVGTFRDESGKDSSAHLGFLNLALAEILEGENLLRLWARIRYIAFPFPGRDSKYVIRFDLMLDKDLRSIT